MLRLLGNVVSAPLARLRTVLVVDEAHLLPQHCLKIRLLSTSKRIEEKLLQVILCGQPELHIFASRNYVSSSTRQFEVLNQDLSPHETASTSAGVCA